MLETDTIEQGGVRPLTIVPADPASEVGAMIQAAINKGHRIEDMERLFALYERANAIKAKQLYGAAMADFRARCPEIARSKKAVYKEGTRYSYADLDQIQATIDPILSECGLSYRWGDAVIVATGLLTQACIVAHVGGHEESASITIPTESSAGMSAAQKYASAGTYARRYSLVAVLGLKYCAPDNDGANDAAGSQPIAPEQEAKLYEALVGIGANVPKFLAYMKVAALAEIQAKDLPTAWVAINQRRQAKA